MGRRDGEPASGAIGEECYGVVGGGVAVDGDGVEGFGYCRGEEGLEGGWGDGGVDAEDPEEGGHVGVDHAGAFGEAGEAVCLGAGGECELLREEFRESVGCADCSRGEEPVIVGVAKGGIGSGDFGGDLFDGKTGNP